MAELRNRRYLLGRKVAAANNTHSFRKIKTVCKINFFLRGLIYI